MATQTVDALAALAKDIKRALASATIFSRKTLEAYRRAGELLTSAKTKLFETSGKPGWKAWLKTNKLKSAPQCEKYMAVAAGWDKLADDKDTLTLDAALVRIGYKPSSTPANASTTPAVQTSNSSNSGASTGQGKGKKRASNKLTGEQGYTLNGNAKLEPYADGFLLELPLKTGEITLTPFVVLSKEQAHQLGKLLSEVK